MNNIIILYRRTWISSRLLLILITSIALLNSCEKEITLDIPTQDPKVVIEGWIEQGKSPLVVVTKSAPYFDPIDSSTLINSIVQNAVVTVSDGSISETLILTFNPAMYPFIMYTGSTLKGVAGGTYDLTVVVDSVTYSARTTIPPPVYLDSAWFELEPGEDSLGYVYGLGSDDASTDDYYRMYTMRKNKDLDYIPIFGSVWDDRFFNGQEFVFTMYRGFASNVMDPAAGDDDGFGKFKIGDTVYSRLAKLDPISFAFWKAAESEIYSGGNPFTNSTSIPTNIIGGALGVWYGYGASYDTTYCN